MSNSSLNIIFLYSPRYSNRLTSLGHTELPESSKNGLIFEIQPLVWHPVCAAPWRQGGRRARGSPRLSVITQPAPRPMIETSTDHRSCGPEIFINLPAQIYHLVARSSTGPISQFRPELSPHTPAGCAEGVRLRSSLGRLPDRVRWKCTVRFFDRSSADGSTQYASADRTFPQMTVS